MQGKLVKQSAQDGQASELLKLIAIKKRQDIEFVDEDNVPFALPKNWAWSKLSGIGSWTNGSGFPLSYQGLDGLPYLYCKVSDMNLPGNEIRIHHTQNTIDENIASKIKAKIHPVGTVIFPKIGGAIATNKRRILAVPAAIDNNCLGIDPLGYCSSEWLHLLLSSIDFMQYQTGTSIPAINQGVLGNIVVGVPPLAEQQRIVARVEELFVQTRALAKELSHSQIELDGLNKSALSHLLASETTEEFNQHWDFIAEHFDLLFQSAEHVAPLRQSILELAVRGKLTRREAGDEPAKDLLKRSKQEKAKIGKEKPVSPVKENEKLFELPDKWEWVKLGEIGNAINFPIVDGPFGTSIDTKADYIFSGVPVIRMMNVKPYHFIPDNLKYVSQEKYETLKRHNVLPGDVLFSKVGAGIGEACLVPQDFGYGMLSTTGITRFRVGEIVLPEYLNHFLNSYREEFVKMASRTAQPFLNMGMINNVLFPLPPLAEQERIVKRVEQLLQSVRCAGSASAVRGGGTGEVGGGGDGWGGRVRWRMKSNCPF